MKEERRTNFVGFHRGIQTDYLQRHHPAAFLLLCLIARRARYSEDPCQITGLRFGEAFVGDWREAGLKSEKSYRCAKDRLEKGKLCVFRRATAGATKGAGRGTVATLLPQGIFSISVPKAGKGAGSGQGEGEIGAASGQGEGDKQQGNLEQGNSEQGNTPQGKGSGSRKFNPPTESEFIDYLVKELPKINPEWDKERATAAARLQYETFVENGWKDGHNKPVKNWKVKTKNIMTHKVPRNYGPSPPGSANQQRGTAVTVEELLKQRPQQPT